MEVSDKIQLVMMILTTIGLLVTIIALLITVRNFRKQLKLSFFADYTKRYQEIMLKLPESVYKENFNYDDLNEKDKKDFMRYMRVYFDLCSEEYHLWKSGHIDKKVWKEWTGGIEASLSRPAFQEAWKLIEIDKRDYKDFYNFMVNDIQNKQSGEQQQIEVIMKYPNWFKISWWIFLLVVGTIFLYSRYPAIVEGGLIGLDFIILPVWLALCLLPLFEEFSILGMTFKKEVKKLKSEISKQLTMIRTDIQNTINLKIELPSSGEINPQKEKPLEKNAMEYKILNTLWTQQVNKFPSFSPLFTFTIGQNSFEYLQFREAGGKLIGEKLLGETRIGQYYLTHPGWGWCKDHYKEFPTDQWWPEESIIKEQLKIVMEAK